MGICPIRRRSTRCRLPRCERLSQVVTEAENYGAVGAVALDRYGNLAAATSTGGRTNKLGGRVGDLPNVGAGTYANDATVAVSCSGKGEEFIRSVTAHTLSALIEM